MGCGEVDATSSRHKFFVIILQYYFLIARYILALVLSFILSLENHV